MKNFKSLLFNQVFSIALAFIVFAFLCAFYYAQITFLNSVADNFGLEKILLQINWSDVLIGLTIYLKTSIDFALLISLLMNQYKGLKNRAIIEIGTALGNGIGTMAVLVVWFFFKEVVWLLALMIFLASLVLFKLALTSLEHLGNDKSETEMEQKTNIETNIEENFEQKNELDGELNLENNLKIKSENPTNEGKLTNKDINREKFQADFKSNSSNSNTSKYNLFINQISQFLTNFLIPLNRFLAPIVSRITPDLTFDNKKRGTKDLILASFTIPFILGLDDFAGYVPLFSVVKVFGFGLGVFLGHFILNFLLFLNPNWTIRFIKNPLIAILGSAAFTLLGFWGIWEVLHLLTKSYFH